MTDSRDGDEPPRPAAAGLPAITAALAPEIARLPLFGEPRATCQRCPKLPENAPGRGPDHPWVFDSRTRCCTYHPELPSYLVGRALARGGVGAERLRARLADPTGVSAWGVRPSDTYVARRRRSTARFGTDPGLRCPFWVSGPYSCGVWADRSGVCRTWFCMHDDGPTGRIRWTGLREVLTEIEQQVAERLIAVAHDEAVPTPEIGSDPETWEVWFRWCARRVEAVPPVTDIATGVATGAALGAADIAAAGRADADSRAVRLARRRAVYEARMREPPAPMPDVLVPAITDSFVRPVDVGADADDPGGYQLGIEGYSPYDGVAAPGAAIWVFAAMDGARTWREAVAEARRRAPRHVRDPDTWRALLRALHRIGALRTPEEVAARFPDDAALAAALASSIAADAPPDVLVPALQRPICVGDRVWLQGAPPRASVVTSRAVFALLARLDGVTPWRDAVAETPGVTESLVRDLLAIDGLRTPAAR